MKKTIKITLRIITAIFAWIAAVYVLQKYEYLTSFADIDNIVGMIPVMLSITFAVGISVIICLKWSKRSVPTIITLGAFVILSATLFPTALRGNWWIGMVTNSESETRPDLTLYAPFAEDTLAVKLDEESTLRISENFPRLDGATALYPIYSAFTQAVYDYENFSQDDVLCTNTRSAYEKIITGETDIIFVATASEQQLAAAESVGADLHFTPIGREAFVFLVGKDNPVDSITQQQIRNIYSGKTAYWNTLGWHEGGRIIAFQRPEGSGSQTGLQFFMADKSVSTSPIDSIIRDIAQFLGLSKTNNVGIPIQVPQPLPDSDLIGTNSLMNQVSVEWDGVQPALGYSYRYFATTMYSNPDAKLLAINGTPPTFENIRNGSYPFAADFYAVTNGKPQGNTKLLIDWILSPQGQTLIERTGYAPLPD